VALRIADNMCGLTGNKIEENFFILIIKKIAKVIVDLENCITFADETYTKTLKTEIKV